MKRKGHVEVVHKREKSHSQGNVDGRPAKKKRKESFSIYIYKVLRQIDPQVGISSKSMVIMNNFMTHLFELIAAEAAQLLIYTKQSTMKAKDIQTAIKLLLPGELAKHAISEGTKAIAKYNENKLM